MSKYKKAVEDSGISEETKEITAEKLKNS